MKLIIKSTMLLTALAFGAGAAMATGAAKGVFDTKYPGNTVSCFVCHVGNPGALTSYGTAYVASGGNKAGTASALAAIEGIDSDADGFTNLQEITAKSDAIAAASTPFTVSALTLATGAAKVKHGNLGTTTVGTATYAGAYAPAAGNEILGNLGVSITVANANDSVTLMFEAGGVTSGATLYDATGAAVANTTINADGSVTFPVATANATFDIIVDRTAPATTVAGGGGAAGGDSGGCIISPSASSNPMMIGLLLLALGFLTRKVWSAKSEK